MAQTSCGCLRAKRASRQSIQKNLTAAIERKARRCLRGTQRRYGSKITVDELKTKIRRLVTRILQDEDSTFDEQTIDQARSQSLFDYRPELRSGLNEIALVSICAAGSLARLEVILPIHAPAIERSDLRNSQRDALTSNEPT